MSQGLSCSTELKAAVLGALHERQAHIVLHQVGKAQEHNGLYSWLAKEQRQARAVRELQREQIDQEEACVEKLHAHHVEEEARVNKTMQMIEQGEKLLTDEAGLPSQPTPP